MTAEGPFDPLIRERRYDWLHAYGLVADLFVAVPDLVKELKAAQ